MERAPHRPGDRVDMLCCACSDPHLAHDVRARLSALGLLLPNAVGARGQQREADYLELRQFEF
jgi:hypothetical protein